MTVRMRPRWKAATCSDCTCGFPAPALRRPHGLLADVWGDGTAPPHQGADDLHTVSGSSSLPRVEVLKHLEHRLHNSRLPPASLPPAMACPLLTLLLLGALLAGEPSAGLAHLGGVCGRQHGALEDPCGEVNCSGQGGWFPKGL